MTSTTAHPSGRTRLAPEQRRTQLLDLGVALLADRTLDELTVDLLAEEAGVSRGLLYHYFGGKQDFQQAVVRRAVDELVAQTAPPAAGSPLERLTASMAAFVDHVSANHAAYRSIVRAARGGNEALRRLHEEARTALTDRIFTEDTVAALVTDTPAVRLVVAAWAAYVEDLVLGWLADPSVMTRDRLVAVLAESLPGVVAPVTLPG